MRAYKRSGWESTYVGDLTGGDGVEFCDAVSSRTVLHILAQKASTHL